MSDTVIWVVRRDLRASDNPLLRYAAFGAPGFKHLLPVYVFPPNQMELSGFLEDGAENPYPEARSQLGKYWRCGPHRAKFIGEAVWDLKESLEALGSGLIIRVGPVADVVRDLADGLEKNGCPVRAVWMTNHQGTEEKADQDAVEALCNDIKAKWNLWFDEKYFIDDRDLKTQIPSVDNIFTTYRRLCEPLREKPRAVIPSLTKDLLPKLPDLSAIPGQSPPFMIPNALDALLDALVKPVASFMDGLPEFPEKAVSSHPFQGGETRAKERLKHIMLSDDLRKYQTTRTGLMGTSFSTKLSAYLAQGCITARQIHHALVSYEDGTDTTFEKVEGYGAGENEGTASIRVELLWRDYMRLCHRKFGPRIFYLSGFKGGYSENKNMNPEDPELPDIKKKKGAVWKTAVKEKASPNQQPSPEHIGEMVARFNAGTTGMGLIDAAQRELLHTGYVSNRARQNVANFLAKHLEIDWRYGAEWYEMLLVDYDVSSNWANWQYVAGVGTDPRGDMRIFNPVKQAFDYDKDGSYVRSWVPEVATLKKLENLFQAWTASEEDLEAVGLMDHVMVTDPLKRIMFSVAGPPEKTNKRPFFRLKNRNRRGPTGFPGSSQNDEDTTSPTSRGAPSHNASEGQGEEQSSKDDAPPRSPAKMEEAAQRTPPSAPRAPRAIGGAHGAGRGNSVGTTGQQRGGYSGPQRGGYLGQQLDGSSGQQRGGYLGQQRGGYSGQQRGGYWGQQPDGYPGQHRGGYPGPQRGGYSGPQRGGSRRGRGASRGFYDVGSHFQGVGRGRWEFQFHQHDG